MQHCSIIHFLSSFTSSFWIRLLPLFLFRLCTAWQPASMVYINTYKMMLATFTPHFWNWFKCRTNHISLHSCLFPQSDTNILHLSDSVQDNVKLKHSSLTVYTFLRFTVCLISFNTIEQGTLYHIISYRK